MQERDFSKGKKTGQRRGKRGKEGIDRGFGTLSIMRATNPKDLSGCTAGRTMGSPVSEGGRGPRMSTKGRVRDCQLKTIVKQGADERQA